MDGVGIRDASTADLDGLVGSSAALFAEDGALRDKLRNPGWPEAHGAKWCAELIAIRTLWFSSRRRRARSLAIWGAARLQVTAYAANEDALRLYRSRAFAPLSITLTTDL